MCAGMCADMCMDMCRLAERVRPRPKISLGYLPPTCITYPRTCGWFREKAMRGYL